MRVCACLMGICVALAEAVWDLLTYRPLVVVKRRICTPPKALQPPGRPDWPCNSSRDQNIFMEFMAAFMKGRECDFKGCLFARCCKNAANLMRAQLASAKIKALLWRANELTWFVRTFKSKCKVFHIAEAPHKTCEIFEVCFIPDSQNTHAGTVIYGTISRAFLYRTVTLTIRATHTARVNDAGGRASRRREQTDWLAWKDWAFAYTYQCNNDDVHNLETAFMGMRAAIRDTYSQRPIAWMRG